jgi:Cu/Zn superoxide dismutase
VPRYRSIAVAALAVSALLLTSSAAYAGDHDFHRDTHLGSGSFGEGSEISSMSWGFYNGEVTDYETTTPDFFKGARVTARMMGLGKGSYFAVQVRGVDKDAQGKIHGAHLHEGPCIAKDPTAAGPHYNTTRDPITKLATLTNGDTEVWLDLHVNSVGNARTTVNVPFVPTAGEHSIVFHADATVPSGPTVGSAGTRLACLPFTIQKFPEQA